MSARNSSLVKLNHEALLCDGSNYLEWAFNMKINLGAKDVKLIVLGTDTRQVTDVHAHAAKKDLALVMLITHLQPALQKQFMMEEDPEKLWKTLLERFGDRKKVILPRATHDYETLKFSDFKSVSDYNNRLCDIVQRLTYCSEEASVTDDKLISKTLLTMHPSRAAQRNAYRNQKFTTYNALFNQMMADEDEEKIVIANHDKRIPASNESHFLGRLGKMPPRKPFNKEKKPYSKQQHRDKDFREDRSCYKCGIKGHLASSCKSSQATIDRFKSSEDYKGRKETHHVDTSVESAATTPSFAPNFMESLDTEMSEVYNVFDASTVLCGSNCLIDSATTNTILSSREYFQTFTQKKIPMSTIGSSFEAEGCGRALVTLGCGRILIIDNAIYQPRAKRQLLALKDIRMNGIHTATEDPDTIHFLTTAGDFTTIIDSYSGIGNGLYPVTISPAYESKEGHAIEENKVSIKFDLWHSRMGHPSDTTMRNMIGNIRDFPINTGDFSSLRQMSVCEPCVTGKLKCAPFSTTIKPIARPLERLSLDLCGPINPACGPFVYFQVLVDESTGFINVSLLSTKNMAFARLLSKIINFKAQYPDNPIKHIRCDNAGEYSSEKFTEYCESVGITVEYSTPYTPQQNGRAEAANKSLLLVVRPLLIQSSLPMSCWGHAVLHAAALLNIRSTNNREHSSVQLLTGIIPTVSHIRVFGCAVYVPVPSPKRTKLGLQRSLAIYIGYDSKSIIRYLEPGTGMMFTARFVDCVFDETVFPTLGGGEHFDDEKSKQGIENDLLISGDNWPATTNSLSDPRTSQTEVEVVKILSNQAMATHLPDGFNDAPKILRDKYSFMQHGINEPERVVIELPNEQSSRKKRGRPKGSLNKNKVKNIKHVRIQDDMDDKSKDGIPIDHAAATLEQVDNQNSNREDLSLDKDIEIILTAADDHVDTDLGGVEGFSYHIAKTVLEDPDPCTVTEARLSHHWKEWQRAMETELASLASREVFGAVQEKPVDKTLVGNRWVFVTKRNEEGEVERHKARLVAKGYSQRYGLDYDATYSPVMDATTFRFLTAFATHESLEMNMMDVVTAYLYGSLDKEIFMNVPDGISYDPTKFKIPCVLIKRSLYGLKQSGRMWYQRLSAFLIKNGFKTSEIAPCVFIKRRGKEFTIIVVYVDDLNLIGTPTACKQAADVLSNEFEMKDLGQTKFCLAIQLSRARDGILMHQSTYIQKLLDRFEMSDCKPVSTPMVVRKLDVDRDEFRPADEGESILDHNYPYLSAVGALMYLSNQTRPDISFAVNLLARHCNRPTMRHWQGIKQVLRYLKGTHDMGLFYDKTSASTGLVGYADAGYQSDPTSAKSQTGYVFLLNGTAISWRSQKQTVVATSTCYAELIALYEATREAVWLRSLINHIFECTGFTKLQRPTVLFEDNASCIEQIQSGFIKGDKTKHISPKFFFTSELNGSEIDVTKIPTEDNIADVFTKSLPSTQHWKLIKMMGLRRLSDMQ